MMELVLGSPSEVMHSLVHYFWLHPPSEVDHYLVYWWVEGQLLLTLFVMRTPISPAKEKSWQQVEVVI